MHSIFFLVFYKNLIVELYGTEFKKMIPVYVKTWFQTKKIRPSGRGSSYS